MFYSASFLTLQMTDGAEASRYPGSKYKKIGHRGVDNLGNTVYKKVQYCSAATQCRIVMHLQFPSLVHVCVLQCQSCTPVLILDSSLSQYIMLGFWFCTRSRTLLYQTLFLTSILKVPSGGLLYCIFKPRSSSQQQSMIKPVKISLVGICGMELVIFTVWAVPM